MKTLRTLIDEITAMQTEDDFSAVGGHISNCFQHEEIKWQDYERLFKLSEAIGRLHGWCI